jgi:hypothetical protein
MQQKQSHEQFEQERIEREKMLIEREVEASLENALKQKRALAEERARSDSEVEPAAITDEPPQLLNEQDVQHQQAAAAATAAAATTT